MTDSLHDFQNRVWLKPLVRQERGSWKWNSGQNITTIPANLFPPVISGIPTIGQVLTVSSGTWTQLLEFYSIQFLLDQNYFQIEDENGQDILADTGPYTYQWLRNGVPIFGAQANFYTLTTADVGQMISASVIATNNIGPSSPAYARAVGPIAAALAISGTPVTVAAVGEPYAGFTVSATGGWTPYLFNVTAGLWPVGITMNANTGVVSGTPTKIATSAGIVITVTDRYGLTASLAPFNINVAPALDFNQSVNSQYLILGIV